MEDIKYNIIRDYIEYLDSYNFSVDDLDKSDLKYLRFLDMLNIPTLNNDELEEVLQKLNYSFTSLFDDIVNFKKTNFSFERVGLILYNRYIDTLEPKTDDALCELIVPTIKMQEKYKRLLEFQLRQVFFFILNESQKEETFNDNLKDEVEFFKRCLRIKYNELVEDEYYPFYERHRYDYEGFISNVLRELGTKVIDYIISVEDKKNRKIETFLSGILLRSVLTIQGDLNAIISYDEYYNTKGVESETIKNAIIEAYHDIDKIKKKCKREKRQFKVTFKFRVNLKK